MQDIKISRKQYKKFLTAIKNILLSQRWELVFENRQCIHLREADEDLFVPKYWTGHIILYYVKDGYIREIYSDYWSIFYKASLQRFFKHHEKRRLRILLQNDDETKAYI